MLSRILKPRRALAHGEPVAEVISVGIPGQDGLAQASLFDTMRRAGEQANLTEEEVECLAVEAVRAVRAEDSAQGRCGQSSTRTYWLGAISRGVGCRAE